MCPLPLYRSGGHVLPFLFPLCMYMYLLAGARRLVCHRLVFASFVYTACAEPDCCSCCCVGHQLQLQLRPKPSPMQMEIAAELAHEQIRRRTPLFDCNKWVLCLKLKVNTYWKTAPSGGIFSQRGFGEHAEWGWSVVTEPPFVVLHLLDLLQAAAVGKAPNWFRANWSDPARVDA